VPTEYGDGLIDRVPCSLVPKASFLAGKTQTAPGDGTPFVYANAEDAEVGAYSEAFVQVFRHQAHNAWASVLGVDQVLSAIGRHRTSWLYVHGYYDAQDPLLSRIALAQGGRLTVRAVLLSPTSFDGCELHLYACWSARASVGKTHAAMGLTSAFLTRGAHAVVASLWPLRPDMPPDFAAALELARDEGLTRAEAFKRAWDQDAAAYPTFEGWLRRAPLVLYGRSD
jgi:hypothetical protein